MDSAQLGVFMHVRQQKCGHYRISRLEDPVIAKAMGTQKVPLMSLFLKCTQKCDSSLIFYGRQEVLILIQFNYKFNILH